MTTLLCLYIVSMVLLLLALGGSLMLFSAFLHNALFSVLMYNDTCQQITSAISSASWVYSPGKSSKTRLLSPCYLTLSDESGYLIDISHWMVLSTQQVACSVEPGTAGDVGVIVCLVMVVSRSMQFTNTILLAPNSWLYQYSICGRYKFNYKAVCLYCSLTLVYLSRWKAQATHLIHDSRPPKGCKLWWIISWRSTSSLICGIVTNQQS